MKPSGRILAIDYGTKRVGIAVTDPERIIANGLTTVHSNEVVAFLKDYCCKEHVKKIIVGEPRQMDGSPCAIETEIQKFINSVKKHIPEMAIERVDERFTSKIAFQTMIDGGLGRKARQKKELVDKVSATLILQSYMEQQ